MTAEQEAAVNELAVSASAGDRAALDRMFQLLLDGRLLQPPVRRMLFDDDDVQVAEQQALVAIATKLDSWSGTGSFLAWARQIASNEAKMVIRSRERRRGYEHEAANRTTDFVARMSSQLATAADVERCIAQLDAQQRASLELRREGLSYGDIARRLDIPEGTVKTRVRMARASLAEMLAGSLRKPGQ